MNKIRFNILIILLLIYSGAYSQQYLATAHIDTNVMWMGDQTTLHIILQQPQGKTVYWPPITENINDTIEVLEITRNDTIYIPNSDMMKVEVDLLITSFDTGMISIPPIPFVYAVINDSTHLKVETNAIPMYIASPKVDMQKGIADNKPILEAPWSFQEILPFLLWIVLALAIISLGIYIYYRWKNNKPIIPLPKKPKIPPHIIAFENLAKLKEKKLWQNDDIKGYYSELTDIIRTYIEGRLDFGAMEMITDEIIEELSKKTITIELLEETKNILEVSDFVKFAKIKPLPNENEAAMKWAYDFVNATLEDINANKENEEVES